LILFLSLLEDDKMKNTYTILQRLSQSERALLRHNLAFVPANNKGRKNKILRLADFLLSEEASPSNKKCLDHVYGKGASGKKIINLGNRLSKKVAELLISDLSVDGSMKLDEQDKAWIKIKKKMAQFYALFYSGYGAVASLEELNEALLLSKEYEYYDIVSECLKFKKWMLSFREGNSAFESVQNEILQYKEYGRQMNKAADLYYQFIINADFSGGQKRGERHPSLLKAIEEIRAGNEKLDSKMITYYLKLLQIDYHTSGGDFLQARRICLELITLIRTQKSVFRKNRISFAYANISRCELYLYHFDQAVEYSRLSLANQPPSTANFSVAKEQEFYALFYEGAIEKAHKIATMLLETPSLEQGDFRHDKYRFFIACTYFQKGYYKRALGILDHYQEIGKDKTGWNISARLLRIMCHIEVGNGDHASSQIETLRKQVEVYSSKTLFSERHKLIIKLLHLFEKEGFSFKMSNPKILEVIQTLTEEGKPHSWELLSSELIPIHLWIKTKTTGRSSRKIPKKKIRVPLTRAKAFSF
jgi:hypothetical protein